MKKAIIFDIDGTLSDLGHRRHFVTGGNRDWDSFFNAMSADGVTSVALVAAVMGGFLDVSKNMDQFPYKLLVFTGRPDSHKQHTINWLKRHVPVLYDNCDLHMRKAGDHRPDTEVKREMLNECRKVCDPVLVFDDRPSVIAMWKKEGLTVLEHNTGEWDNHTVSLPGKLTIMVGPSGAGKSTYVKDNYPDNQVICSDALRMEIGAFNDMSKNGQVFGALNAMVKARIENGFDAVVDATNIHAKDRRSIRDVVPENTVIEYVIIDRPLGDKQRDAGWRAGVSIEGVPLIFKHHNSFQSGIKYVLAGDSDPRVTVVDKRQKN